jgi:hypothetical protein
MANIYFPVTKLWLINTNRNKTSFNSIFINQLTNFRQIKLYLIRFVTSKWVIGIFKITKDWENHFPELSKNNI